MICTAVVDNQNSPLSWKHRRTSIPLQPCCSEWPVGQQHWTTWGPVRNAESWTSPWASQMALVVKNPPEMWETRVQSLGWEDALEEGMAIHSSILAWRIPWTEEPGGLQSIGLQRVGHNWSQLSMQARTLSATSWTPNCLFTRLSNVSQAGGSLRSLPLQSLFEEHYFKAILKKRKYKKSHNPL